MASSPYLLRLILLSPLLLAVILITTTALTPCATTRTPTTSQAVFTLSRPHPVTYDFATLAPSILITVPAASHWRSDEAFHEQPGNCANLLILAGEWGLVGHGGGATICHAGYVHVQHPRHYLTWFRQDYLDPAGAMLRLDAPVQLYRTVCSVTQEAPRFFTLCDTPLWLRSLYSSTYLVPFLGARIRERMVSTALWYQLRVVYEVNDYWTYEGKIPYAMFDPFPTHSELERQRRSAYVVTKRVVRAASWVGRTILGMQSSYDEYEVKAERPEGVFGIQEGGEGVENTEL